MNTTIESIVESRGDRALVAFIHNRHQSRVSLSAPIDDALDLFLSYGGDEEELCQDWQSVDAQADLGQYIRNAQPESKDGEE